jgi:probable rRNA maturation factor
MGYYGESKADMAKKKDNSIVVVFRKKVRMGFDAAGVVSSVLTAEGAAGAAVNIVFVDNAFIRRLNLEYRGKNYATDVISFGNGNGGDVFISVEKAAEQADAYGATFDEEAKRLIIHGTLHVLGYDHIKAADGKIMVPKEKKYFKLNDGAK